MIDDKIYGSFEITEPVLLELLQSAPVLRLKKICQYGVPDRYYELKNFSRYEHSLGVMLCLRYLSASVEEQIAGLLHDVPHLAFSHVADWVFADGRKGKEDYHESLKDKFLLQSEIPAILKKHGFDPQRVFDEHNFSLMENTLPDVCADRFDYAIEEFYRYLDRQAAKSSLEGIISHRGEMVFKNQNSASIFARDLLRLQLEHWGSKSVMTRYYYFSEILRLALQKGVIEKKDFDVDDNFMMAKIIESKDNEVDSMLNLMEDPDFASKSKKRGETIYKKFRYVDPKILFNNKTKRLSELDPEFKEEIEKQKELSKKGIVV